MTYNASQTKSGICHDLRKSEWQAYAHGYMFSFSTVKHRDKFLADVEKKVEWLNDSMSRRFHVPCDFTELAVVQLYMSIEGRGFRVWNDEKGILWESPNEFLVATEPMFKVFDDCEGR